jgi:hypothetical protein
VHHNSREPARFGALAFARGSDIHLGPGQERHLPHEAWHVVQQKEGRVETMTLRSGIGVSLDTTLEAEAEDMGRAIGTRSVSLPLGGANGDADRPGVTSRAAASAGSGVLQMQTSAGKATGGSDPPSPGIEIIFDRRARRLLGLTKAGLQNNPPPFLVNMFRTEYGIEIFLYIGSVFFFVFFYCTLELSVLAL